VSCIVRHSGMRAARGVRSSMAPVLSLLEFERGACAIAIATCGAAGVWVRCLDTRTPAARVLGLVLLCRGVCIVIFIIERDGDEIPVPIYPVDYFLLFPLE
jgi:hypothetical protein